MRATARIATMSYNSERFHRVMAGVRIATGFAFCVYGGTKLFDPTFFESGFQFALGRASATAADWYYPVVHSLWMHPGIYAVAVGMLESFLGLALVLGLATRPASLVGMVYMLNKIALTWHIAGQGNIAWQVLDAHMEQLAVFGLLLLFLVGHAGETWGLGALYHSPMASRSSLRERPEYKYLFEEDKEEQKEPQPKEPTPHN